MSIYTKPASSDTASCHQFVLDAGEQTIHKLDTVPESIHFFRDWDICETQDRDTGVKDSRDEPRMINQSINKDTVYIITGPPTHNAGGRLVTVAGVCRRLSSSTVTLANAVWWLSRVSPRNHVLNEIDSRSSWKGAILGLSGLMKSVESLCCGVRSKRDHSFRNNGTVCDAAFRLSFLITRYCLLFFWGNGKSLCVLRDILKRLDRTSNRVCWPMMRLDRVC